MTKLTGIAALLFTAWALDQHYYGGYFTDSLLSMLSQMRHSFGW
jgi:hypothetical protein